MKEIFQEIRDLEMQMGLDVKAKISEIKIRKGMQFFIFLNLSIKKEPIFGRLFQFGTFTIE